MKAFVGKQLTDLNSVPSFLRFNDLKLQYDNDSQPIAEKCQLFKECLQQLRASLSDLNEFFLTSFIDRENSSDFSDHLTFLNYLRDELLPIFKSSRRHKFIIGFNSDENSAANLITSILELSQQCSHLTIGLGLNQPTELPVVAISDWLAGKSDRSVEIGAQKPESKLLQIVSSISNAQEMWEHQLEVSFNFKSSEA